MTTADREVITLPIEGMTCASCVGHVVRALEDVQGVETVTVNLGTEKASVAAEVDRLDELVRAVEESGYSVGTEKVTLGIGGMTCASCVGHVERALEGVPGAVSASVNLATENAVVEFVPGVAGVSDMRQAVGDAGYTVVSLIADEREAVASADIARLRRSFVISLAAAGAIMALMAGPGVDDLLPFRLDFLLLALATPFSSGPQGRFTWAPGAPSATAPPT